MVNEMANTVCILLSKRYNFDVRGGTLYVTLFLRKSVLNKVQTKTLKERKTVSC
jgi:hypothetical protein